MESGLCGGSNDNSLGQSPFGQRQQPGDGGCCLALSLMRQGPGPVRVAVFFGGRRKRLGVECYSKKVGGLLYHVKTLVVLVQVSGPGFVARKTGPLTGRLSGDESLRDPSTGPADMAALTV